MNRESNPYILTQIATKAARAHLDLSGFTKLAGYHSRYPA